MTEKVCDHCRKVTTQWQETKSKGYRPRFICLECAKGAELGLILYKARRKSIVAGFEYGIGKEKNAIVSETCPGELQDCPVGIHNPVQVVEGTTKLCQSHGGTVTYWYCAECGRIYWEQKHVGNKCGSCSREWR